MEPDQNQVHLTTQVSSKDKELPYVSNPLCRDAKSQMMLEVVSDMQEDDGTREDILRREDATESKLDETLDKLLEYLDATIAILGANVNEDDDSGGYVLSDPKEGINETEALGDSVIENQNAQNNQTLGCQTAAKGENMSFTVSLDQNGKCDKLNELAESLMILLMLFSLYLLLSSMI